MSEVATTLRSCYLAGPMRGYDEFNFPAFHKQTAWLRGNGWKVFSPAERDEADPVLNGEWAVNEERGLDYFMQWDLAAVAQTDAVVLMEGWEESQGARLESVTAVELNHPVFEIVYDRNGDRFLASVEPAYIRAVFFAQGQLDQEPVAWDCVCEEGAACTRSCVTVHDEEHIIPDEVAEGLMRLMEEATAFEEDYAALSAARKATPIASGVLDYFPAALAEIARVSKAGNDKHNPGEPLHHARGKSTDHADSLVRHLLDRGGVDPETGMRHSAEMAWRALALLQQELEDAGAPLARGARLPD